MGTEPLWSPEIVMLVYKDLQQEQLTKILFKNEEEALVGTFSDYCENY